MLVMGDTKGRKEDKTADRIRILYPSGECEYIYVGTQQSVFRRSCFIEQVYSLKRTLELMERFDTRKSDLTCCFQGELKIKKVIEL